MVAKQHHSKAFLPAPRCYVAHPLIVCEVCLAGAAEQLATSSRDLAWEQFTAAQVKVGTVINVNFAGSSAELGHLRTYCLQMDFGCCIGVHQVDACLSTAVFESAEALVNQQLLAVVNLRNTHNTAAVSVLSVGGKAFLRPAKHVHNGFTLA